MKRSGEYESTFGAADRERDRAALEGRDQRDQRDQRDREPFDEGETLLVCERGRSERLRVARKSYKGHTYFDLRVEFRPEGEDRWLGTKRGLTIKARELADVAAALEKAVDQLADGGPR